MVDVTLVIFGLVALLAIALGVTMYRVVPCWLRGETISPETETPEET
jgi:Na+/H+-dicarboxylate symporter